GGSRDDEIGLSPGTRRFGSLEPRSRLEALELVPRSHEQRRRFLLPPLQPEPLAELELGDGRPERKPELAEGRRGRLQARLHLATGGEARTEPRGVRPQVQRGGANGTVFDEGDESPGAVELAKRERCLDRLDEAQLRRLAAPAEDVGRGD